MRLLFVVALILCSLGRCSQTEASYTFVLYNETGQTIKVNMNHGFPSAGNGRGRVLTDSLSFSISEDEVIFLTYVEYVDSDQRTLPDYKNIGLKPMWDEYYIKEFIVADTIIDEDKWRDEELWTKVLRTSHNTVYYLEFK